MITPRLAAEVQVVAAVGFGIGLLATAAFAAAAQDNVVYHIDDMSSQALKGLRNIRNHIDTDPSAKITVVTHAFGVDFLMEGMKDRNESPFAATVAALVERDQVVAAAHMGVANENLRHGAPAGDLHHVGTGNGVHVDADFLNLLHAFGLENLLGANAVRADGGGVHLDGLHGALLQ